MYLFDNKHLLDEYGESCQFNNKPFKKQSKFILHDECLKALSNNHRDEYKTLAKTYQKRNDQQLFNIEDYKNENGILRNSLVNNNGIIIKLPNTVFVNGGCRCKENQLFFDTRNVKKYDKVVSITSLWAGDTWHFPFEAFVALMALPISTIKESKIHISKINNYTLQWLKFLDIDSSQVITGNIYADEICFPKMGKCGNPYYEQLLWIKDIMYKNILNTNDKQYKYVTLIKRNNRRCLKNFDDLKQVVSKFAKTVGLELYIHDDKCLPSLVEQHNIFYRSKYVFAAHGAGGINIPAMRKDALYVEFLDVNGINICYSRLAYLLDINYMGVPMKNFNVDIGEIKNLMKSIVHDE